MIVSFNYNHSVDQYLSFVSDWNTRRLFLMLSNDYVQSLDLSMGDKQG